ncbi:unnamed protein product [Cochlearia groenlandica]
MTLHLTSRPNVFHLHNHPQSLKLSSTSRFSVSLPPIPHRTHFESLILCARRRKKSVGYQRIARFLLKSLSLLSSNLQILPQPLDLVIADLNGLDGGGGGGGGGGGIRFWRGWGRFDGWRRKKNRVPILLFVCLILWVYGFCRISGKEIKSDQVLKVLGVCLFGVSIVKEYKREAKYLVFVFLCLIVSLVFGCKKESFVRLATRFRSCSSILVCKRTSRRRV